MWKKYQKPVTIGDMVVAITNKEILEQIEYLKKKLPNGELTLLKKSVEDLQEGQRELRDGMKEIKKQLLDPDNGVVVRVNRNSEFRREKEEKYPKLEKAFEQIHSMVAWKNGVTKILWVVFTALIGLVIKVLWNVD